MQALTGAVSTIKFFLSEAFLGQHFEAVELEGGEPELGDLFLFRLMSPQMLRGPFGLGAVPAVLPLPLVRAVLRRRSSVDPVLLERKVRQAMEVDPPPYHPMSSNCVHFALRLLAPDPSLDPLQIDQSSSSSVSTARLSTQDPIPPPEQTSQWA
ncbi:hypothetical protein P7K49_012989 [Saguinus oedipus]|uniref:PPPDE domain-containing protein n=1 Tax=Saguinus oedipus TaxID=9490 RepID=A0ABQ9VEN1_SAGOE|nr:hypothetical protein P7K49_012989 [Saguinus oedipus]